MMNYAIIGFGGLGKVHFRGASELYKRIKDVKLVAICDVDETKFYTQTETNLGVNNANLDLSAYHLYTDVNELFEKEKLDFVITALPTYIHEKIAVMAMERGIHVFSEKPMARTLEQAENMLRAAKENNVKLMIGQVERYVPCFAILKELIDTQKYGKVIRAHFSKISPLVIWSWQNWMLDEEKSGGAALDLHIHDADFINWIFGMPKAVTSVASNYKSKHSCIYTTYHYEEDMLVTAVADWSMPLCYPFAEEYTVRFEKATLILYPDGLKIYPEDGEASVYEVENSPYMVDEVEDFLRCILEDKESAINPPESNLDSLRIVMAEKMSADTGKTVAL